MLRQKLFTDVTLVELASRGVVNKVVMGTPQVAERHFVGKVVELVQADYSGAKFGLSKPFVKSTCDRSALTLAEKGKYGEPRPSGWSEMHTAGTWPLTRMKLEVLGDRIRTALDTFGVVVAGNVKNMASNGLGYEA